MRMRMIISNCMIIGMLAVLTVGCERPSEPGTPAAGEEQTGKAQAGEEGDEVTAQLIAREQLFGNPRRTSGRVSPDGRHLSFLAPHNGVLNVWVGSVLDPAGAEPVTDDDTRGIRRYFWAHTSEHVIYLQDKGGDENWRVYSVDLDSGEETDLTPLEDVAARVQHVSPRHPEEILVGLNDRDESLHDIYRVNILSGQRDLVEENPGFSGYLTDDEYNVRGAMKMLEDGSERYLRRDDEGEWQEWFTVPHEDTLATAPIGFDAAGGTLYMYDSRDRNTAALVAMDVASGEFEVLLENEDADVSDVTRHPVSRRVEAAAVDYTRKEWTVLDDDYADDFDALAEAADGELSIHTRTRDDNEWVVGYEQADEPPQYYRYDRNSGTVTFLFATRPGLSDEALMEMNPVTIESRDGLDLVSYLTLPPVPRAEEGSLEPEEPVPMVLLVHGGPWGRDSYGFNNHHQWLANRGYAVLSVNFRGSTGFGKDFINAGDQEWAGRMHDDLIDAVEWAVDKGIATKDQVAIMGGSYGGYATLVGLTFTPEAFACGVDIVGPSNLNTLLESIPPYWEPVFELFARRVGDPRTEEGRKLLAERSPLSRVDRITKPLLIGQGANDPRVKQAESDQIVEAMQDRNIPVTYVLFPDEGHGFARPENSLAFNAVAEAFLGECLGGHVEPIGDDFEGSSIRVPEGAGHVPGLEPALEALPERDAGEGGPAGEPAEEAVEG